MPAARQHGHWVDTGFDDIPVGHSLPDLVKLLEVGHLGVLGVFLAK